MARRINFSNPFRPKRKTSTLGRSGLGTLETFDDYGNSLGVKDQNLAANNYNTMPGVKSIDPNAIMGQLGKFYEEYGPSLQYLQRNPGMRGITEAGLDYGMRSLPGVGPAYGAIQDFNRATGGGINVGKAFGIKQDPFKALGNRIFGDPNKSNMTPAQLAIMGRNATRSAALENAANADIASARMERDKLGVEQRNVMDLLSDMTMNPSSSRDLAATVGAGVAPLQELASKRMADSRANIARRGLSGGMATGIIEGNRQTADAGIADIYNRTTLEAMSRRPQMASMLAGVIGQEQARLDARDNAARGMIGQIDQQEFAREMERERMGLERDRLAAAERASNLQGLGALAGQFGPDILNELKRLRERPSKRDITQPLVTQSTIDAENAIDPDKFTFSIPASPETPLAEGMGLEGQGQDPFGATSRIAKPQSPAPMLDLLGTGQLGVLNVETEARLMAQYPSAQEGFITPQSDQYGNRFVKTKKGWRKYKSPQTAKSMNAFADFATNFGQRG
jgi:hypothetical protein